MKYIRYKLTKFENASDIKVCGAKIETDFSAYDEYMQDNPSIFTKKFLNEYTNGGFHDCKIADVSISNVRKNNRINTDIILTLTNDYKKKIYTFNYKNVQSFNTSFSTSKYFGMGDYLYGEIYKENELLLHNFLFSNSGDLFEMNISCKRIMFNVRKMK